MSWMTGADICTLPCVKQTTNKNLLYSTGHSAQHSVMIYMGKESTQERIYGHWEKALAAHSSAPAWTIPWMEEPGGLRSMRRVGHD